MSACSAERPATDTSKLASQPADSVLPVVIDTRLATIVGIALREQSSGTSWCLHTSRADIRPNDFVKVVFAGGRLFLPGTVGAPKPACVRSDTIAGVRNFVLKIDDIAPGFAWFGVVVRGDVNGRLDDRRGVFEAELDTVRGNDFIQDCSGARAMHLFATSGDTLGPVVWHYAYRQAQYDDNTQPTCNGRFGEPLPDTTNYEEDPVPDPPGTMNLAWADQADSTDAADTWLALRPRKDDWELVETKLRYKSAGGSCGEDEGGRAVEPTVGGEWLAVVTGAPGLSAGPVTDAVISDSSNKYFIPSTGKTTWGDTVRVVLSGKSYMIHSEPAGKYGLRIAMQSGDKELTLYSAKTQDEGSWSVLWAGDLDRDGEPDILLAASRKYSVDAWYLHLSSFGRGAERWLPVARYVAVGC